MGTVRVLGMVALLGLGACATVTVRKIGPDGEPTGPSGIRFYRNRPYVVVNEPFVVGAKPYIVGGAVSVDGRYLLLDDLDLDKECRDALGLAAAYRQKKAAAVDATRVVVGIVPRGQEPGAPAGGPQAQVGTTAPGAPATTDAGKDTAPVSPVVEEQAGLLNLKATNDNSAFAITKLKRYFDVVYLPDFDEDYVVQGSAGLGNTSVNVALGQSWSFQGIDASEDNGPLARRFLNLLDHGASLLTSLSPAAQAAVPSILSGTPTAPAGGPQGSVMTLKDGVLQGEFKGGTPVSAKVTLVRIVAPGLYKILKPKELELLSMTQDTECRVCDGTRNLDVFACKYGDRLLLPVPPFTDVAFNTYPVAVIEAARPSGDSALQPAPPAAPGTPQGAFRTGAPPVPQQPPLQGRPEGDVGTVPPPPPPPPTVAVDEAKLRVVEAAINARLLRCRVATGPYWMARLSGTPTGVFLALEVVGDARCGPAIDRATAAEVARQEVMAAGLGAAVVPGP